MKRLSLLGATGSIGVKTLDVVRDHPDEFRVVALAAGNNLDLLEQQVKAFHPRLVSVATDGLAAECHRRLGRMVEVAWGVEGLLGVATASEADLVVSAIVGAAGLVPTMAAVRAGKDVAVANKESLVMAGELLMAEARARGARILPVDSEHSAIFQCLAGSGRQDLRRVILTASGGPFRTTPRSRFAQVTPEEALNHPTWPMGKKITIDSATLMNKGFEVIEARWLFGVPVDRIEVIVHPQSIVHSLVEFVDGSVLAQLGVTDMRLPILYALSFPQRRASLLPSLDLVKVGKLSFEPVDGEAFPCLGYGYEAARRGGSAPTVLNAANEAAVHLFLERRLPFDGIPTVIRRALDRHDDRPVRSVEEILEIDREVRAALFGEGFGGRA